MVANITRSCERQKQGWRAYFGIHPIQNPIRIASQSCIQLKQENDYTLENCYKMTTNSFYWILVRWTAWWVDPFWHSWARFSNWRHQKFDTNVGLNILLNNGIYHNQNVNIIRFKHLRMLRIILHLCHNRDYRWKSVSMLFMYFWNPFSVCVYHFETLHWRHISAQASQINRNPNVWSIYYPV